MNERNRQIKISLPFLSNLGLKIAAILNRFLVFFQLREKREFWGIVYDSVSKQPLDPVKVNLVYADTGKSEAAVITDLEGRYGFLARPGKFKILVQRTNYTFPSQLVRGDTDGIYTHLYHGEFFQLFREAEVVAPNIPMDPAALDWNQQAKLRLVHRHFYWVWFLEKLIGVLLWFGFIFASAVLILSNFQNPALRLLVLGYFVLFVGTLLIPSLRLWGMAVDSQTKGPIAGLQFELINLSLPGVVFGRAASRDDGRFFLRANPGSYVLEAKVLKNGQIVGSVPIKVGKEGVVNQKILINGLFKD